MTDPELEALVRAARPREFAIFEQIKGQLAEEDRDFVKFDQYLGPAPADKPAVLLQVTFENRPSRLVDFIWENGEVVTQQPQSIDELALRYFRCIEPALRMEERSFDYFRLVLGPRPLGAELREIPGRRRPAFRLAHFEWVRMTTPRVRSEPNRMLRALQEQIHMEELEKHI